MKLEHGCNGAELVAAVMALMEQVEELTVEVVALRRQVDELIGED